MLDYDRVAAGFGAAAATCERAAAGPREIEARLLDRLGYLECDVRRVLDLGAGTGHAAVRLARHFAPARVVALDLALPLLRRIPGNQDPPISGICADAAALPLADASFDLVCSNLVLPWCADPGAVFAEVRRVLKPGGAFLFTTLGPDTLTELRSSWAECDDRPHVHPFIDMHLLGDGLLQCGFSDPVMDVELLTFTYRSVDQLLKDLKDLGGRNLLSDRRRSLTGKKRFAAMVAAYERRRADGRIPARCEVIYGLAWGPPAGQPDRRDGMEIATFPVEHLKRSRSPGGDRD